MRTEPFYSLYGGIAVEDLWHDNDACDIVGYMLPTEYRPGQDQERKHCQYCQVLNSRFTQSSWQPKPVFSLSL